MFVGQKLSRANMESSSAAEKCQLLSPFEPLVQETPHVVTAWLAARRHTVLGHCAAEQQNCASRHAADTTTSLTRLVHALHPLRVCLSSDKNQCSACLQRGSAVCSEVRGRMCKQSQAWCHQTQTHFLLLVLEAVWNRGWT